MGEVKEEEKVEEVKEEEKAEEEKEEMKEEAKVVEEKKEEVTEEKMDTEESKDEDKHSYAITMAGKKCTQKYFENFTETPLAKGDVVTACLDLDASPRTVSFLVNGENATTAFEVPEVDPEPEPEPEPEPVVEEKKDEGEKEG